jgi:two-component system sensor histidine kinase YesM
MPKQKKKPKLFIATFLSFLLLVLLPTMIIFIILSTKIRNEMIIQNTQIETNSLYQTALNIENEIKNNSIMASSIVHNEKVINEGLNFNKANTLSDNYNSHSNLDQIFQSYLVTNNFAGEIYLVFNDNEKFYLARNATCIDGTYEQLQQILFDSDPLIDKTQIVDTLFSNVGYQYPHTMAIVTYPPANWGYEKSYDAEILISPLASVKQFYNKENFSSNNTIVLVNSNNDIIASNKIDIINSKLDSILTNDKKQIVIKRTVANSPWTLIKIVDPKEITKNVDKIFAVVYILLIILFILYIAYNIVFLVLINRPLNKLIENMKEVGKGKYKKYEIQTFFEELDSLSNSFYSMVDELEVLNKQIQEAHLETLKNEIEALRFQINPHFMCNSLSAIRMMAMIAKNDAIKRMSTSLMIIMEDNLNGTGSFSTIKHELKNIESYIYIMQVRYGNTFNFKKDIDEKTLNAEIPSMLLQPLIENSILHGLRNKNKDGLIKLSIKKVEDTLEIIIFDNGVGVSRYRLKSLFDKSQKHSKGFNHIGLSNVKRRLELLYQNEARIELKSKTGDINSYFKQKIIIPLKKGPKNIKIKYGLEDEKNIIS